MLLTVLIIYYVGVDFSPINIFLKNNSSIAYYIVFHYTALNGRIQYLKKQITFSLILY